MNIFTTKIKSIAIIPSGEGDVAGGGGGREVIEGGAHHPPRSQQPPSSSQNLYPLLHFSVWHQRKGYLQVSLPWFSFFYFFCGMYRYIKIITNIKNNNERITPLFLRFQEDIVRLLNLVLIYLADQ